MSVQPGFGHLQTAHNPLIVTPRLTLRLPAQHDIDAIIRYYQFNKDHLAPWEPERCPSFYTPELWQLEVDHVRAEFENGQSLWLYLFPHNAPDEVVGCVNFTGILRGVGEYCFLGYSIAENRQGRGLMTEALCASIDYVFGDLNLHRIMADYQPNNERSGKLLKRLGFVVEGYARDFLRIDGQWEDHILTSLTNPHWSPR